MKNAHLLLLFFSAFTSALHAQNKQSLQRSEFSLGPEYAIPIGAFRERYTYDAPATRYNYGIGASIKYLYHVNSTYGFSLQSGAIRYHSNGDKGLSFTAIPFKLGGNFRYKSMFAEPQLGLTWFADNNTVYQNASTTYGLNIGTYITSHMILSGAYERWNRGGFGASHLGIRLAYALNAGRRTIIDSSKRDTASNTARWHYDKNSEYWRKHTTFKTLGWVSVGVGVPLTLLGLVTAIASIESTSIHESTYEWMIGSGTVIAASGIPFFIFSHKYKKMARTAY